MIYIRPHLDTPQKEIRSKTFSYSEVENLIHQLVLNIDNLELMHENNIQLIPIIDSKDRVVHVFVRQGQKAEQLFFDWEDR